MQTENKKREVPKQLQNELYDKVEPYIERIIAAYEKEGLGFSRFSLKSIGMQCAAIGYYHESDKDQLQDTTLVPIEEDTQLNVTPGEWIVYNDMIKVIMDESKGIQGGIICVGKLLDDRIDNLTLMAQSKNMYAALVKVYSEIQDQLLAHRFGEILGEIKTTLNNCKPKP